MGKQAAVLGYPIGHSLSPALHNAAYRALGLTGWSYRSIECSEKAFPDWFAGLPSDVSGGAGRDWAGLSLTMPLKQVVLPLLDSVSDLARVTGSVNTVTWDDDSRSCGENTDVHGIIAALASIGVTSDTSTTPSASGMSACILGAGATASSAVAALAWLGCTDLTILARSPEKAGLLLDLAGSLSVPARHAMLEETDPVRAADVVVCTLPAPVSAEWFAGAELGLPAGALLDVTYHPWPPAAVQRWQQLGGPAVGGFEMLLQQAGEQFRLMTGLAAPLEAMRAAASPEA